MNPRLLTVMFGRLMGVPSFLWQTRIKAVEKKLRSKNIYYTKEHRAVHHFIVRELPSREKPFGPDVVADGTGLSVERARTLMDELEKRMTYLWRNPAGEVAWAYPVTLEPTPHKLKFSTGEETYAA